MDNYLASREIKDSEHFYFNISFEFLTGCQFSCEGCHVNKDAPVVINDDNYRVLKNILESFKGDYYKPFIAFINPTDFLVANNTIDILSDPRVIDILSYFKRLSFQSTFLNIANASSIGSVLRKHYSDKELELNILIEPHKITNEKYLTTLKNNQSMAARMIDWPTEVSHFGIMNVFNYSETKLAEMLSDYEKMHKAVEHLFKTTIDFNFSFGRKGKSLEPEHFKESVTRIRDLFNDSIVTDNKKEYLRFSFGKLTDSLIERQYNWSNGKFYYSPLLYERYVSFVEELEIPIVHESYKDFEEYEANMELSQYLALDNKESCGECPLLSSCVNRGILGLMDIHEMTECSVARDAMGVVNAMGALPI